MRLAEIAVKRFLLDKKHLALNTLGAALYRAGRLKTRFAGWRKESGAVKGRRAPRLGLPGDGSPPPRASRRGPPLARPAP